MGGLSIWHWLVVLAIVLVLFGRGRVSDIMGEFGKGIKSFKDGLNEDEQKQKASQHIEGPQHEAKPASEAAKDPQPAERAERRN
ncbi:MAG: twin-arginine translocase TatA/TatE family subunit [Sphingomonadaceae bacterium]